MAPQRLLDQRVPAIAVGVTPAAVAGPDRRAGRALSVLPLDGYDPSVTSNVIGDS